MTDVLNGKKALLDFFQTVGGANVASLDDNILRLEMRVPPNARMPPVISVPDNLVVSDKVADVHNVIITFRPESLTITPKDVVVDDLIKEVVINNDLRRFATDLQHRFRVGRCATVLSQNSQH